MHDKFKKRASQAPKAGGQARHQIAVEAARRMFDLVGPAPDDPSCRLREASESEYYTAKRKAAAVLGHRVRPGRLALRFRGPRTGTRAGPITAGTARARA